MRHHRRWYWLLFLLPWTAMAAPEVAVRQPAGGGGQPVTMQPGTMYPAASPPAEVQTLFYREALFHYFQDDSYTSLTHLEAAEAQQRLPRHGGETDLLVGTLYLGYGLPISAEERFQALVARPQLTPDTLARAWFFLAKSAYQRGHLASAETAFARSEKNLPSGLSAERRILLGQLQLVDSRYADAARTLQRCDDCGAWTAYARYNRAVALLRSGHNSEAESELLALTKLMAEDEEQRDMRDRAYLALGQWYLQRQLADAAAEQLLQVRLDGSAAPQALLTLGWAYAQLGDYSRAAGYWHTLALGAGHDPAAQEALLAAPYAYLQAGEAALAAQQFAAAIEAYAMELTKLDRELSRVQTDWVEDKLCKAGTEASAPSSPLAHDPLAPYLTKLLARQDVHTTLRNCRDLQQVAAGLARAHASMPVYSNMVLTRRLGYERLLPQVQAELANTDIAGLQRERDIYRRVTQGVAANEDATALANYTEQRAAQRLNDLHSRLARLPDQYPQRVELARRLRVLEGTVLWRMDTDYKRRLRRATKGLQEVETELLAAQQRRERLELVMQEVPRGFMGFDTRIATQAEAVDLLHARAVTLVAAHHALLAVMLREELQTRRQQLTELLTQARYALAQFFDRTASP